LPVSPEGRLREGDLWRHGLELHFETAEGHRQYVVAYPFPPLEFYVGTDLISGHVMRREAVQLTLRTAGRTVKSTARPVGGSSNRFETRLRAELPRIAGANTVPRPPPRRRASARGSRHQRGNTPHCCLAPQSATLLAAATGTSLSGTHMLSGDPRGCLARPSPNRPTREIVACV